MTSPVIGLSRDTRHLFVTVSALFTCPPRGGGRAPTSNYHTGSIPQGARSPSWLCPSVRVCTAKSTPPKNFRRAISLHPTHYCQVYSSEKFSPSYIPPPYTLRAISLYPTRLCPPAPSYVPHPISSELHPFTPYLPGYAPPPHTSRAMPGAAPLRPRLRTVVPFALHSGRSSPPRAARMMVGGGVGPDGLPLC